MNKKAMRHLAEVGAQQRVAVIEKELNDLQKAFPSIFVSNERPVLLKAQLRHATNGDLGSDETQRRAKSARAAWTPERRAKMAAYMRRRQKKGHIGGKHAPKNWADRWYKRLVAHGPERLKDSGHALKATASTLLSSSEKLLEDGTIVKKSKGVYGIGKERSAQ